MLFNSLEYLIFLPAALLIFQGLNDKYKPAFLLIASYLFYFWLCPSSPLILIFTTLTGYFFAFKVSKESFSDKTKQKYLFTAIFINTGILICFREIFQSLIPAIGISFFTFQNISYLIDCYLEKTKPEKNFFLYALYISFFPKLLQGPIERASNLLPQFKGEWACKYEDLRYGAQLFFWGMFKKVVIADNLSKAVNGILNDINGSTSFALFLLTYLYAIQLYCDFSGYTDMALGSARLFGIKLTDNFNLPYFAVSIQDFWRKWHITLSAWILDYIFKPLQMKWRNYGNYGIILSLIITFLACGLWHGVTLNYIVWGLYHGILISISYLTYKKWQKFCKKKKLNETLIYLFDVIITFHLVCFGWLIFMTQNLSQVYLIMSKNLHNILHPLSFSIARNNLAGTVGVPKIFYLFLFIFVIIEFLQIKYDLKGFLNKQHVLIRWTLYYVLIFTIIILGVFNESKFIYFGF